MPPRGPRVKNLSTSSPHSPSSFEDDENKEPEDDTGEEENIEISSDEVISENASKEVESSLIDIHHS